MQRVGAIVSMVCMYFIGGPLGLCLLMLTDLSVSGELNLITYACIPPHFCHQIHPKIKGRAIVEESICYVQERNRYNN